MDSFLKSDKMYNFFYTNVYTLKVPSRILGKAFLWNFPWLVQLLLGMCCSKYFQVFCRKLRYIIDQK